MKTLIYTSIVAFLLLGSSVIKAQEKTNEYLGLPGDNLNLYAVMNLFQESETLEGFEKSLNDPEKMVNNLDLNSDNKVDYIMVVDYSEENVHNIVLRVAINKDENQDVAVFIVEKRSDGSARVQLIGDEILYGKDYIIEPAYAETPNPGYNGNVTQKTETVETTTYYEVASWPVIVYVYEPSYVDWSSSWYWGCYTPYWHSWAPHYWHYYYGYHYHWHSHYCAHYRHRTHNHHDGYHHGYYANNRRHSNTVTVNIHNGKYANTYNRPERKADGEKLFADKFPEGIKEKPLRKRPNDPIATKPNDQNKPAELGKPEIKGENDSKPYTVINARPSKDPKGAVQNPNSINARDNNRVNSDNPNQRKPEPAKPESIKPQRDNGEVNDNATPKPTWNRPTVPTRTEERPIARPSEPVRTNERPYTRPSEPVRNEERPAARPAAPARTEERPAARPAAPVRTEERPAVRESSSNQSVRNSNSESVPKQSSPGVSSGPKSNDKPNKIEGRKR